MKKRLLYILLCVSSGNLFSQANTDFINFNAKRNKINRHAMYVLGGWGVANMGFSGVEYSKATGSDRYFHQMNLMWGGINALIAGGSLLMKDKNDLNLSQTVRFQNSTEKTFAVNAAVDLLYSSAGLYLTERARNDLKHADKYNGWGNSLIMQGGFLFLFDATIAIIQSRHGKKHLSPLLDKATISTSGLGLRIGVQL